MRPDPVQHAKVIAEAYGIERARWVTELNRDHAHDDATRDYWQRAFESLPAQQEEPRA